MMRVLVAALATTSVVARWSDPNTAKEMAKEALERRHSLVEQHQKGYEKRHHLTPQTDKRHAVGALLSDEQKRHVQSRMLKRTRGAEEGAAGANGIEGTASDRVKKGMKEEEMELNGHHLGDSIVMTAGRKHKPKSDKSPSPGSPTGSNKGKAPSNGKKGKPPSGSPPSPTPGSWDSKTGKGGKSRKISSGICTKRLLIAFEEIVALGPDGPFGTVQSPSDVTDLCAFVPPEDEEDDYNFGCPFLFIPQLGFIEGEAEYVEILGEDAGKAFNNLVLYCQCHQGFDLGCAAKIPHGPPTTEKSYETKDVLVNGYSEFIPFGTPAERADYCKMAGVWNGDFESDIAEEFSPDVADCGCFFVGTAKDMVGTCPGVDLGAFFEFPPTPTPPDASFYDSFEDATFPDDPWSVSNSEIYEDRRLQEESSPDWALTMDEAFEGEYSIKAPDWSKEDSTPRWANVTLTVGEDWEALPGTLSFWVLATLGEDDYLEWFVDNELAGRAESGDDKWEMYDFFVGEDAQAITWVYFYNPLGVKNPSSGEAYLDEVIFVPSTPMPTDYPTFLPTQYPTYVATIPSFSPTSGFPTYSPEELSSALPTPSE